MSKYVDKKPSDTLYKAFLTLKTEEECRQFMEDLCTVSELKAMEIPSKYQFLSVKILMVLHCKEYRVHIHRRF